MLQRSSIKAVKNAGYESVTATLITPTFLVKPTTPVADNIYGREENHC